MKLQRSGWLVVALLVVGAPHVNAQTTYTLPTGATFMCDAEGYAGQLECRGIPMADSADNIVGQFTIFSFNRVGLSLPGLPPTAYGTSDNWVYPFRTLPPADGKTQASFSFDWSDEGHTGTASGTFVRVNVCSNRCWVHPKLLTFTVTMN